MSASHLVECYWPGVSEDDIAAAAIRADIAARGLTAAGRAVRYLGSVLIPRDEVVFCRFHGDLADVAHASSLAELPFERVLECVELPPRQQREEQS